MRNLTAQKSHRASKPVGSTPVVSKLRPHSVLSKKRVGKRVPVQNKESTTNRVGDEADDASEEEAYTKPVKDISMKTYTLQKLVMLGSDSIMADTGTISSVDFHFCESIPQHCGDSPNILISDQ